MTIEIPDWCKIGLYVEWSNPRITGCECVTEKIIAYSYNGFFHQAHNCPMYFTEFSEYGRTVKLKDR